MRVTSGKRVWEVRLPVRWDKGRAVGKIMEILRRKKGMALPIYIGDDKTDEDAFLYLRKMESVTVFVGNGAAASSARYYLRSPCEVRRFLERLCRV